jgi:hypothetical protein
MRHLLIEDMSCHFGCVMSCSSDDSNGFFFVLVVSNLATPFSSSPFSSFPQTGRKPPKTVQQRNARAFACGNSGSSSCCVHEENRVLHTRHAAVQRAASSSLIGRPELLGTNRGGNRRFSAPFPGSNARLRLAHPPATSCTTHDRAFPLLPPRSVAEMAPRFDVAALQRTVCVDARKPLHSAAPAAAIHSKVISA